MVGQRPGRRLRTRAGVLITVRVHPRASRRHVAWKGTTLEIWVTAPPAEGAANQAVLDAVAHALRVPRSTVSLRSGSRSRTKLVEVKGR